MGILDDARALQSRKRVDRLLTVKQKKIKGATYLGKDPIDGTDIVQVDGGEPVSGFRLISNNPISIGDRVSLRPSQGGLQRVDAPNVKPDDVIEDPETLLDADLGLGILISIGDESVLAFRSLPDIGIQKVKIGKISSLNSGKFNYADSQSISSTELIQFSRVGNIYTFEYTPDDVRFSIRAFIVQAIFRAKKTSVDNLKSKGIKTSLTVNGLSSTLKTDWVVAINDNTKFNAVVNLLQLTRLNLSDPKVLKIDATFNFKLF